MKGFFKCSADSHGLTHGFHRRGNKVPGFWKFFKCPARYFYNTVIKGRFKRCKGFSCNIVCNFVKSISHSQLGCNLGNRKACSFGGKSAAARNPWIHFNYDHLAVFRINGKLNIRSTGINTDLTEYCNGCIPHYLVFFVTQGLNWSNRNAVTCVYPHWVHIFNGTYNHNIVISIPHYLKFILFPA